MIKKPGMTRDPTHDTSTACTMRQPCAQRVNLEHNASTSSTTRQPRAQRVNHEHNASTASTTCQPRAQRVNRKHNASTTSTARQPGAQRVAHARPMCATHCLRPRCIARHSQCINPRATTMTLFTPGFSASRPASLNPTTRQLRE